MYKAEYTEYTLLHEQHMDMICGNILQQEILSRLEKSKEKANGDHSIHTFTYFAFRGAVSGFVQLKKIDNRRIHRMKMCLDACIFL